MKCNIAIWASGSGTNAAQIVRHFQPHTEVSIMVFSNNKNAFVLERAHRLGLASFYFSNVDFAQGDKVLATLQMQAIDYIVLAGYLRLVSNRILAAYPERIINIHPSLLPKFGGKGMYGMRVHRAVIAAGERQSGITIHYCGSAYDQGKFILQAYCSVEPEDEPITLAKKIQRLEHRYYPQAVEAFVKLEE